MTQASTQCSLSKVFPRLIFTWIMGASIFLFLTACSTNSKSGNLEAQPTPKRISPAAYAADGMTLDHRMPDSRPYKKYDFFYKSCSVSRDSFPSPDDWACTDPF
jgi:hypothetical protein